MSSNLWILKSNLLELKDIICSTEELYKLEQNKNVVNGVYKVCKYLEKPYLYKEERADIKVYIVVFCYKKDNEIKYKCYIYNKIFLRYNNNKSIILLSDILDNNTHKKIYNDIKDKIKICMTDLKYFYLDNKIENVYEIYELDFLLDKDYNTYLNNFKPITNYYPKSEYLNILKNKDKYIFNMIYMIILKVFDLYNKDNRFITEKNKDRYKNLCEINKFKKNFENI
jgi:hypothetical protein